MAPQRAQQLRDKKRSNESTPDYFPSKHRADRQDYIRVRRKSKASRSRSCSLASGNTLGPGWEQNLSGNDDETAIIKPSSPDPIQCPKCLNYSLVTKPITSAELAMSFACFPLAIYYKYYAKRKYCKICHSKFK
uniref:LITAF domain-containing protein n=1 Tax=Plectus sambesii TaxID=2011161 RepID=A0A914WVC5_9BILA